MAHPLNRPTLDPVSRRVVDGYAVLQPRVTPALPTGLDGSIFQRVFRTRAASIHMLARYPTSIRISSAKALIAAREFTMSTFSRRRSRGRIPDNTLLSHDLLEGIYARAGLVSDIEVVDEFPARYDVAVARQYRWGARRLAATAMDFRSGLVFRRRPAASSDSLGRQMENDR